MHKTWSLEAVRKRQTKNIELPFKEMFDRYLWAHRILSPTLISFRTIKIELTRFFANDVIINPLLNYSRFVFRLTVGIFHEQKSQNEKQKKNVSDFRQHTTLLLFRK